MPRERSEWLIEKTEAIADHGMVTADQPLAARAGLDALRAGGNAVDAAVTAAFAMGVVEPFTSGVGGVAVAVIRTADGHTAVIDGSTTAPLGAREDMFRAAASGTAGMYGWPATVGNENNVGPRSVGVPGMVGAMALALERHGTFSLRHAIEPALALARDGFEIDYFLALATSACADRLWPNAEAKRVFFKEGGLPYRSALGLESGDRVIQSDLARTLETIADGGPQAFYRGPIADAIVEDARALGGILTREDFAEFEPRELAPLTSDYRGWTLVTVPETSGGITVIEALNLLEGFRLGELEQSGTAELHLIAEASRRAFVDRLTQLADPRHTRVPFERLASKEYAEELRRSIDPAHAGAATVAAGADAAHTTHICAIDARRTMVSLTTTLGQGYGSGVVPRGTGIVLADVMTWFDPVPGRANSIAPGKRILWAPSPVLALRGGRPAFAVGAPGGRKLITSVLQTIVNLIDHADGPQAAVNRPRVHCEGRQTLIDARVREDVRHELAAMGHELVVREETIGSGWFGRPNAIAVDAQGMLRAGVNRLKPSIAMGH